MSRPSIRLYYDIVSPFAYIAYYILKRSPTFKNVDVTFVPVFLGGIMKATGNRPPIAIKNKDKWIELERHRWAKAFNVPVAAKAPDGFPVLTIAPMRALTAISIHHPDQLLPVTDKLYEEFWGPARNEGQITKPENLAKLIASVAGEPVARDIMEKMGSEEIKAKLQERSDLAFNDGAFGLPWFVAEDGKGGKETYWGVDHMGMMTDFLGLERLGPLASKSLL